MVMLGVFLLAFLLLLALAGTVFFLIGGILGTAFFIRYRKTHRFRKRSLIAPIPFLCIGIALYAPLAGYTVFMRICDTWTWSHYANTGTTVDYDVPRYDESQPHAESSTDYYSDFTFNGEKYTMLPLHPSEHFEISALKPLLNARNTYDSWPILNLILNRNVTDTLYQANGTCRYRRLVSTRHVVYCRQSEKSKVLDYYNSAANYSWTGKKSGGSSAKERALAHIDARALNFLMRNSLDSGVKDYSENETLRIPENFNSYVALTAESKDHLNVEYLFFVKLDGRFYACDEQPAYDAGENLNTGEAIPDDLTDDFAALYNRFP